MYSDLLVWYWPPLDLLQFFEGVHFLSCRVGVVAGSKSRPIGLSGSD